MTVDAPELADHWWWRPGWQVGTRYYSWHVTFDDQPELRAFAGRYAAVLRPFAALDVVPEQWLHCTLQGLGHVAEVPDRLREDVVAAVRDRLAALAPVTVTFAHPVIHREAVAVDATDPEPLSRARRAVRAGIAQALGVDAVPGTDDTYPPHVSLAYAGAVAGTDGIRAALDAAAVPPVTTTVRRLSLIELHRDDRMYQWRTVEQQPLGGG